MPATTAFLFCVCQAGAEAAVADELAPLGLRRAFARPGLITFKDPSGAVAADVPLRAAALRLEIDAIDKAEACAGGVRSGGRQGLN